MGSAVELTDVAGTGALAAVDGAESARFAAVPAGMPFAAVGGAAGGIADGVGCAGIATFCVLSSGGGELPTNSPSRCAGTMTGSGSSGNRTWTDGGLCCWPAAGGRVNAYTDTPEMIMPRTQMATVRRAVMVPRHN